MHANYWKSNPRNLFAPLIDLAWSLISRKNAKPVNMKTFHITSKALAKKSRRFAKKHKNVSMASVLQFLMMQKTRIESFVTNRVIALPKQIFVLQTSASIRENWSQNFQKLKELILNSLKRISEHKRKQWDSNSKEISKISKQYKSLNPSSKP